MNHFLPTTSGSHLYSGGNENLNVVIEKKKIHLFSCSCFVSTQFIDGLQTKAEKDTEKGTKCFNTYNVINTRP